MGSMLLSAGIPMINAGDEFGRSQGGNNNPYCQDNPISWFHWGLEPWQEDLLATTTHLLRLRREHPALRQRTWALGRQVNEDGSMDMAWFDASGSPMDGAWHDPATRILQMLVNGAYESASARSSWSSTAPRRRRVTLPRFGGATASTAVGPARERPQDVDSDVEPGAVSVDAMSIRAYAASDPT